MKIIHTIEELQAHLIGQKHIAFVPTMGNLHEGHLSLVRLARQQASLVVVSIFVNRLQFAPHEDFDQYPRTLASDAEKLAKEGVYILFAPNESQMYPQPQTFKVQPPLLAERLEGEFRRGFFTGVCTVVTKLFACVQPSIAIFGKKDYQQLAIIREMVKQFCFPIQVLAHETVREASGLALSSRNQYLSLENKSKACELYQSMQAIIAELAEISEISKSPEPSKSSEPLILNNIKDNIKDILNKKIEKLNQNGWQVDYLRICEQSTLQNILDLNNINLNNSDLNNLDILKGKDLVILAAAKLGETRLIDNIEFRI